MNEPVPVDPKDVLDFVGESPLAVLFVSVHAAHRFNRALYATFRREMGESVAFGAVDYVDLIVGGGEAVPFLIQGLHDSGGPRWFSVLPGYWLFAGGRVLVWDSGLPTVLDAKAIGRGALLGALWSGVSGNLEFVSRALQFATEEGTGERVAAHFRAAVAERAAGRAEPPPPRPSSEDELRRAYALLGVRPTASEQEVNDAWRRRRAEVHPDRAAHDPREFERRSQLSVELNRARDLILSERARAESQSWPR